MCQYGTPVYFTPDIVNSVVGVVNFIYLAQTASGSSSSEKSLSIERIETPILSPKFFFSAFTRSFDELTQKIDDANILTGPVKSGSLSITGSEPAYWHSICFKYTSSSNANSFFKFIVNMFELSTVLTVSINIAGGSFSFLRFIFPETITLCSGCKKSLYAAIFELNAIASVLPVKSSIVTNLINLDGSFFVCICFI